MVEVLRVGVVPTSLYNTIGYHASMINVHPMLHTHHVSPKAKGEPLPLKGNVVLQRYPFVTVPKPKNVSLLRRSMFEIYRVSKIAYFSFRTVVYMIGKNIDVIHLHSPMYMLVGLAGWIMRKKVYITYHGEDVYRVKNSRLYRWASRMFSAVFTLSKDSVEELERIHSCPVVSVNNGVDMAKYCDRGVGREKAVLMVSAFKYQKGHEFMVNAFSEFLRTEKGKGYKLLLVGEGILKDKVSEQVERLGLSDSVEFLGYKSSDELVDLYNRAEIFSLPSIWEGFPKVLLEAMSCGCKVICTPVDGAVQVLGPDYKYYVAVKDDGSILDALKSASNDDGYDYESNMKLARRYDWSSVSEPYVDRYCRDLNMTAK